MKSSMPASKLRHLITILSPVASQSPSSGRPKNTYRETKTNQCALVKSLGASEQLKATGQVTVGLFVVSMRYRTDITAKDRLCWQNTGTVMEITGITPMPDSDEVQFTCSSVK